MGWLLASIGGMWALRAAREAGSALMMGGINTKLFARVLFLSEIGCAGTGARDAGYRKYWHQLDESDEIWLSWLCGWYVHGERERGSRGEAMAA